MNQVAESWRTRRVKGGIQGFASIPAAFGHVGRIQTGNPSLDLWSLGGPRFSMWQELYQAYAASVGEEVDHREQRSCTVAG
jgi:hypothetical protein